VRGADDAADGLFSAACSGDKRFSLVLVFDPSGFRVSISLFSVMEKAHFKRLLKRNVRVLFSHSLDVIKTFKTKPIILASFGGNHNIVCHPL
jgi:hypothetical protein